MSENRHTIRNLDRDLILEARIFALQTGQTLGELVNDSLGFYLANYEIKSESDQDEIA